MQATDHDPTEKKPLITKFKKKVRIWVPGDPEIERLALPNSPALTTGVAVSQAESQADQSLPLKPSIPCDSQPEISDTVTEEVISLIEQLIALRTNENLAPSSLMAKDTTAMDPHSPSMASTLGHGSQPLTQGLNASYYEGFLSPEDSFTNHVVSYQRPTFIVGERPSQYEASHPPDTTYNPSGVPPPVYPHPPSLQPWQPYYSVQTGSRAAQRHQTATAVHQNIIDTAGFQPCQMLPSGGISLAPLPNPWGPASPVPSSHTTEEPGVQQASNEEKGKSIRYRVKAALKKGKRSKQIMHPIKATPHSTPSWSLCLESITSCIGG
jgi:hypothetical protein